MTEDEKIRELVSDDIEEAQPPAGWLEANMERLKRGFQPPDEFSRPPLARAPLARAPLPQPEARPQKDESGKKKTG